MRFTTNVDFLDLIEEGHERVLLLVCQRCAKLCAVNGGSMEDLRGFQDAYNRGDLGRGREMLKDSGVYAQSSRIKSVCKTLRGHGLDVQVVRADPAFGMCFVNSMVNALVESLPNFRPDIVFIEACNLAYRVVNRLLAERDTPGFGEFELNEEVAEGLRDALEDYSEDDFVLIRGQDVSGIWWVTKDGELHISGLSNDK